MLLHYAQRLNLIGCRTTVLAGDPASGAILHDLLGRLRCRVDLQHSKRLHLPCAFVPLTALAQWLMHARCFWSCSGPRIATRDHVHDVSAHGGMADCRSFSGCHKQNLCFPACTKGSCKVMCPYCTACCYQRHCQVLTGHHIVRRASMLADIAGPGTKLHSLPSQL